MATVLIVEDSLRFSRSLSVCLTRVGHLTVLAQGGREAMTAFAEKHPDLILLDMNLPDTDGLSLLEALRGSTPVIVLSANDEPERVRQALSLGARKYMVKAEFSLDELLTASKSTSTHKGRRREQFRLVALWLDCGHEVSGHAAGEARLFRGLVVRLFGAAVRPTGAALLGRFGCAGSAKA